MTVASHPIGLEPGPLRWSNERYRAIDLGPKKAAYARAGIPEYWVVDAARRGVWVFTGPMEDDDANGAFTPAGEPMAVPVIGASIDFAAIFPTPRPEAIETA